MHRFISSHSMMGRGGAGTDSSHAPPPLSSSSSSVALRTREARTDRRRRRLVFASSSSSSSTATTTTTTTTTTTSSHSHGKESPLAKFLISGAVAWVFEFAMGNALEMVKILKQVRVGKSYAAIMGEIVGKKGIIGFLDGFFPWGTVQALAKGSVFGFGHAAARSAFQPYVESKTLSASAAEVVSGGIGGGFQGLVLSPILLLKTRVMTDPIFREKMSLWQTTKASSRVGMKVIQNEGVAGLMKGSIVFSGKRVADWSSRYLFAEGFEHYFKIYQGRQKLTASERAFASFMGGVASTLATIPLDVMVAQIQQASKAGQKVSVVESFRTQLSEGGISQLLAFSTRGFIARTLHVSLTTVIMKTGSSVVYDSWEKFSRGGK